jgi:hypothetical protein
LETTRKTKITPTPETNETIEDPCVTEISEPVITALPEQMIVVNTSDTAEFLLSQKMVKNIVAEAPELYGNNWTAQQVEDFKQKELEWRAKLRSL